MMFQLLACVFATCAALLNTGVGLPLFQLDTTISSNVLLSSSLPEMALFILST